jgi:hypothetical protein
MWREGGGRPRKYCDEHNAGQYGKEHRALRRQWARKIEQGGVQCQATFCLMLSREIRPGTPWDLGHTPDRTAWTGPEHARCNRSEGGRRKRVPVTVAPGSPTAPRAASRPVPVPPQRRSGPPDPGPPRPGVVHEPPGRCHCEERAQTMGVWPSQCF